MKNELRRTLMIVAGAGAVAAAACGGNASGSGPTGTNNEFAGVAYTATVEEIPALTTRRFTVMVTLRNTTGQTVTRSYPAGCPVRIRLYRLLDGELVYDESDLECAFADPATITLAPGESKTLQSGPRWPPAVVGDSLVPSTYNVGAVLKTEGTTAVEISAGAYRIPDCREGQGQTICT
jgi:hypothetical protein